MSGMKEAICYIVGAGAIENRKACEKSIGKRRTDDYVIAVDGGYEYLKQLNIEADLLIGDFDSIEVLPKHENIVILPKEKEDTDMRVALQKGLEMGYRVFVMYGALGGRISHTVANLQCLVWLSKMGAKGILTDGNVTITAVSNGSICFDKRKRGYISVFAFAKKAKGVTLKNLKYPLRDAILTMEYPIGTSNEFIGKESEISVADGTLLVVLEPFDRQNTVDAIE